MQPRPAAPRAGRALPAEGLGAGVSLRPWTPRRDLEAAKPGAWTLGQSPRPPDPSCRLGRAAGHSHAPPQSPSVPARAPRDAASGVSASPQRGLRPPSSQPRPGEKQPTYPPGAVWGELVGLTPGPTRRRRPGPPGLSTGPPKPGHPPSAAPASPETRKPGLGEQRGRALDGPPVRPGPSLGPGVPTPRRTVRDVPAARGGPGEHGGGVGRDGPPARGRGWLRAGDSVRVKGSGPGATSSVASPDLGPGAGPHCRGEPQRDHTERASADDERRAHGPLGGPACQRPREAPHRRAHAPSGQRRPTGPGHRAPRTRHVPGSPGACPSARPGPAQSRRSYECPLRPAPRATPANSGPRARGPALDPSPRPSPLPLTLLGCSTPTRGPRDAPPAPSPRLRPAGAGAQGQRGPSGRTGKAGRRRGGQLVSSSPAGPRTGRARGQDSSPDGDTAPRACPHPGCAPRGGVSGVQAPGAAAQTPLAT